MPDASRRSPPSGTGHPRNHKSMQPCIVCISPIPATLAMSYPPKDERRVHLEVNQSEHGMLNGDAHSESPEAELDEVELNLIRRYEDFSTVGE